VSPAASYNLCALPPAGEGVAGPKRRTENYTLDINISLASTLKRFSSLTILIIGLHFLCDDVPCH